MFEFDSIQDFVCKSLIGKVLVKVGDTELSEKIINAWHDSDTNSIVVYSDKSQTFIYNSSFVIVDKLIEVQWDEGSDLESNRRYCYVNEQCQSLFKNEDYGELYSTEEFFEMVKDGSIVDYDGHGYPSNGTHHVYIDAGVRVLAACKFSKSVSHIIWYNK